MKQIERLQAVDALQARYARALDGADMNAWAACFGDPASYICIPRENVEAGHGIATILDDSKDRILDRIKYVDEVWQGTFDPYATRHIVQRVEHESLDGGGMRVLSNFLVAYVAASGVSELLATGVYEDEVTFGPDGALFRSKRAVTDSATTPRYIVYPL